MIQRDSLLAFGTAHPAAGLEQPQRKTGRSASVSPRSDFSFIASFSLAIK
jgi:hypothetical protein